MAFGGIRVEVANEDAELAEELYVEYNEAMKTASFVERPVRAWPIMVIISILCSFPVMLFGKKFKADDKYDTYTEI